MPSYSSAKLAIRTWHSGSRKFAGARLQTCAHGSARAFRPSLAGGSPEAECAIGDDEPRSHPEPARRTIGSSISIDFDHTCKAAAARSREHTADGQPPSRVIPSVERRRSEQLVVQNEHPELLKLSRIPAIHLRGFGLHNLLLGLSIELFLGL